MSASGLSTSKSLGPHSHWGVSSSFDLCEAYLKVKEEKHSNGECGSPLRFLLVNPGDIRHVVNTIAKRRRNYPHCIIPEVHFYILENPVQVIARDLLLLEILCDFEVPIRQRANIFLEVYGNLKVQKRTSNYLEYLAKRLTVLLTQHKGHLQTTVSLDHLNYRDRDELERAIKFYFRHTKFDMDSLFDHRKRGLYEERFDARKSIQDWDYHSGIKSKASIIHIKQYKNWRETGIAYEFGDQVYTEPNKTLMTYTEGFMKKGKDKGIKKEVQGYWGDIVCSPYVAFGIDSETPNKYAEGLYEIHNKNTGTEQHRHHAVEVALYNIFSFLWEIETNSQYKMTKANDVFSGLGKENKFIEQKELDDDDKEEQKPEEEVKEVVEVVTEEEESANEDKENENQDVNNDVASSKVVENIIEENEESGVSNLSNEILKALETTACISDCLHGIKIFPMVGTCSTVLQKSKYKGLFDGIFVSSRYAQILGESYFGELLNKSSFVAAETAKFVVPINKETRDEFVKKQEEFAKQFQYERMKNPPVFRRRRDEKDLEDDVLFFNRIEI